MVLRYHRKFTNLILGYADISGPRYVGGIASFEWIRNLWYIISATDRFSGG